MENVIWYLKTRLKILHQRRYRNLKNIIFEGRNVGRKGRKKDGCRILLIFPQFSDLRLNFHLAIATEHREDKKFDYYTVDGTIVIDETIQVIYTRNYNHSEYDTITTKAYLADPECFNNIINFIKKAFPKPTERYPFK